MKILIVDDQRSARRVLRTMLATLEDVVSRGEGSPHGSAAARELQTRLDRPDHQALPFGQCGKLPHGLGLRQRLERWNILQIRIAPRNRIGLGWRGGRSMQQRRRHEAQPKARAAQPPAV